MAISRICSRDWMRRLCDPASQAAAFDALGEETRDVLDRTHVVAAHDVGMETEVDPGLGFGDEEVFCEPGLEELRPG